MNQCDINYRQSSNKRLLVELTLIEVAQITQPEEGPASGRKPRRLKSLFKQLMQQTQPRKAAPQVAAAAPKPQTEERSDQSTQGVQSTQNVQKVPASQPKLKVSSLGTSWNNLRKAGKMNILPGTPGIEAVNRHQEDVPFTQEDLELQWLAMCNRMPQQLVGIATRMKNMNPVIVELPKIEVVVGNELVKDEMEKIRGSI